MPGLVQIVDVRDVIHSPIRLIIWIVLGNIRQRKIYHCNRNIWYWWHCDQNLGTGQGIPYGFCQPHDSANSLLGNRGRYPKYTTRTGPFNRIIFLADNLRYLSLLRCPSYSSQPPIWQNLWPYTEMPQTYPSFPSLVLSHVVSYLKLSRELVRNGPKVNMWKVISKRRCTLSELHTSTISIANVRCKDSYLVQSN